MIIYVDGDARELDYRDDNGTDYVPDVLGNYDAIKWDGIKPTMSDDAFEWWSEYFENNYSDERHYKELLRDSKHPDSIEAAFNEEFSIDYDLEDEHTKYEHLFKQIEDTED